MPSRCCASQQRASSRRLLRQPASTGPAYARAHATQTKYTLFTTDCRRASSRATRASRRALEPALSVLSHFEPSATEDRHFIASSTSAWAGGGTAAAPRRHHQPGRQRKRQGGQRGEGRNHSGTASAPPPPLHCTSHRSKHERNHTLAEVAIARHFNAIDENVPRGCRLPPPPCAVAVRRPRKLKAFHTISPSPTPVKLPPLADAFDGSCHGYDLVLRTHTAARRRDHAGQHLWRHREPSRAERKTGADLPELVSVRQRMMAPSASRNKEATAIRSTRGNMCVGARGIIALHGHGHA